MSRFKELSEKVGTLPQTRLATIEGDTPPQGEIALCACCHKRPVAPPEDTCVMCTMEQFFEMWSNPL